MGNGIFEFGQWGGLEFFIAVLAVVWTGLLLFQLAVWRRGGSNRLPPGPKGWPLVGALPYLGEFPHRSFFELSAKYGPIMYMRLGSMSAVVVSNAEMAKEVLQANDQIFASRPALLIPTYMSYGGQGMAFAPYGPLWRQSRKISSSHLMTPSKLAHFMGIIKQEILSTIHTILEQSQSSGNDDAKVNLSAMLSGTAMNIITQMMWRRRHRNIKGGQGHDEDKFHELFKTIMALSGANNLADFVPFFKSFVMQLSGLDKKAKETHKELNDFIENIVCEKEQALMKDAKTLADEDDIVTVMLKLTSQPGDSQGLSREKMKATLSELILGGTDTSAVTLDWSFVELMRHPEIMRKLQDELKTVVGEERLVSESDIPHLKYLDAVLKEALRMYSAGPLGIPHLSTEKCKVGGYDVPANTVVFVNHFAIHHDPTVWKNPWEFNPDRFLESDLDLKGRNFQYIPFSSGRRICPGMNLALTFLPIALAQFVHTINWSLPDGQKPEDVDISESFGLVLTRASPLLVHANPRLAHHVLYPSVA